MPQFLVTLPAEAQGASQTNNRDAMLVSAADATEALAVAKAASDAGPNRDKWDAADVLELVEGLESDFAYQVKIQFADDEEYVEFLVPAGEASFAALAAAMELLLEADARIGTNVSQLAGPPVVQTIAGAASIGDRPIEANLLLDGQAIEGYLAVSAPGLAGAARTITYPDQTSVDLPKIQAQLTDEKF
jgi:hypothetical protein